MRRSKKEFKMTAICIALLFLIPAGVTAGEKVYRLKAESVYGPMSKTTTVNLFGYLDRVEKKSNGRIKFQRFSSGQLAKAKEALDAIEVGMFDVLMSYPSYYAGHVPEGQIFLTPFLLKSMKSINDIFYGTEVGAMVQEAFREKGSIVLGLQCNAANVLTTREKISTLSGYNGLKLRAPGGLGKDTVSAMGASPVMLVGSEIYTSVQRGTIDGFIYPLYSNYDYKFYEQAKHIMQPSLGYIVTYIWMSKKTYDKLPDDLQKLVMAAGREHADHMLAWSENSDVEMWQKLKGLGVTPSELSPSDVNALVEKLKSDVWPNFIKNDRCRKIMEICLKHEGWK